MNNFLQQRHVVHVGSRKSQLALIQTNSVIAALKQLHSESYFNVVSMSTLGDDNLDKALFKIGEKSLFTKELEVALMKKEVDFVVHSLKDLPTTLPSGLVIGAVCKRETPFDAVVMSNQNKDLSLSDLSIGSIIGTSSLRRIAQLRRCYPHLKYEAVRGNLNTRLKKLDEGNTYAALVLAAAGLQRMGWTDRISAVLTPAECLYAVGQGALAVECREDDLATLQLLSSLTDRDAMVQCVAERSFMRTLEGGCSIPVAVHSTFDGSNLFLKGAVFTLDGSQSIIDSDSIQLAQSNIQLPQENSEDRKLHCGVTSLSVPETELALAERLGMTLGHKLLQQGAGSILASARQQNTSSVDP